MPFLFHHFYCAVTLVITATVALVLLGHAPDFAAISVMCVITAVVVVVVTLLLFCMWNVAIIVGAVVSAEVLQNFHRLSG